MMKLILVNYDQRCLYFSCHDDDVSTPSASVKEVHVNCYIVHCPSTLASLYNLSGASTYILLDILMLCDNSLIIPRS